MSCLVHVHASGLYTYGWDRVELLASHSESILKGFSCQASLGIFQLRSFKTHACFISLDPPSPMTCQAEYDAISLLVIRLKLVAVYL
jgi:hypothetical protein